MPYSALAFGSRTNQILSHPTWDVILLLGLLAGGFFYGISAGRKRIAETILSTYVAFALASAVPPGWLHAIASGIKDESLAHAVVFVVTFFLLAFLLGGRKKRGGFARASSWWQVFLLSFLQVGLFIHILLGFLSAKTIAGLAPLTKNFIANPSYHFWWFLLPLVVLILLRRIEGRGE